MALLKDNNESTFWQHEIIIKCRVQLLLLVKMRVFLFEIFKPATNLNLSTRKPFDKLQMSPQIISENVGPQFIS